MIVTIVVVEFFIRTDKESGQPTKQCYQCELCGCQWQLSGAVLRVGQQASCKQAQRERTAAHEDRQFLPFSPVLLVVGFVILLILFVYIGGVVAIRFFIPITIAVIVVFRRLSFWKRKKWWW